MPAVGRLGELLVRTHWEFDKKRFMRATPHMDEGYGHFLGTQLANPNVGVLVAEQGREVVGYSYSTVEGRDWMGADGKELAQAKVGECERLLEEFEADVYERIEGQV